MVGPLSGLLLLLVFCTAQDEDCSVFKKEYCNLRLDKILMLDTDIAGAPECQTACFARTNCTQFSFFQGESSRCVLFSQCSSPISSCKSCVSGPAMPRVASCISQQVQARPGQARRVKQQLIPRNKQRSETSEIPRSAFQRSNGPSKPLAKPCVSCSQGVVNNGDNKAPNRKSAGGDLFDTQDGFDDSNTNDENDSNIEGASSEDEDEVNIDDGLLDAVFDELPGTGNIRPPQPQIPQRPKTPSIPSAGGGFYYCIMGGSNANGPVSTVSVMNVGTYAVPRTPPIAPFPSFMTQGNGRAFSIFSGRNLHTCTPGYQARTLLPASTFGPLFGHHSFVPGSCNGYDFKTRQWGSTGGKMTTGREGGTTLNVGSYIMSLGGFTTIGQPVTTIEIFDPRRPRTGWQNVPQWSFPRATRDHCTVVNKDPQLGTQVMVMGGLGEEHSVMKLVLSSNNWFSVPPMNYPRTRHGCTSVTLNGRPGVVVSGGIDTNRGNTSSVEFFDMNTHRWINLPNLSRGRRGHTMTTIEGKLAVVGGVATGFRGEEEYLQDVEVFDGRRWKRANYRLDQPRDGANMVKIPISTFA